MLAAKYHCGVHTHLVESIWEAEEALRCFPGYHSDAEIYERAGLTSAYDHPMAVAALRSAAYTYVVAALGSLATLVYYVMIFLGRSGDD